jgi:hypothetical protein
MYTYKFYINKKYNIYIKQNFLLNHFFLFGSGFDLIFVCIGVRI